MSAFDSTPKQRNMKIRVNCDCYCAMYHDPCPEESPSGMHIISPIIVLIILCMLNSDFVCLETLAATCQSDSSDSTIKSKTIHRLLNHDIDVNSEDCQDQCMEALLRDRTPKKRAKPHAQCRCFCLHHQICLQQEVSGKFPVTVTNFYTY